MGRQTRNFRNTKSSGSANLSARNYAKIQRSTTWHQRIISFIKVRGKGDKQI